MLKLIYDVSQNQEIPSDARFITVAGCMLGLIDWSEGSNIDLSELKDISELDFKDLLDKITKRSIKEDLFKPLVMHIARQCKLKWANIEEAGIYLASGLIL